MSRRLHEYRTDSVMDPHLETFTRTLDAYPVGTCPLTMELTMLHNAKTQSCGKCVPCRDGLPELEGMMESLLDGDGPPADREERVEQMRALAELVRDTSDCAIGYQPATVLLEGLTAFEREVDSHVHESRCLSDRRPVIPCVSLRLHRLRPLPRPHPRAAHQEQADRGVRGGHVGRGARPRRA